jgi:hypothetical protein
MNLHLQIYPTMQYHHTTDVANENQLILENAVYYSQKNNLL